MLNHCLLCYYSIICNLFGVRLVGWLMSHSDGLPHCLFGLNQIWCPHWHFLSHLGATLVFILGVFSCVSSDAVLSVSSSSIPWSINILSYIGKYNAIMFLCCDSQSMYFSIDL